MARLNEPPALVDSSENLRRKFLRQNRDIARVNSNQSLRIRGLENECARLLSENLKLRGQVLRLEKHHENDRSRYIADHALQIKQKMEIQLVELGSLLASFGVEPSVKRLSLTTSRNASKSVTLSLPNEVRSPQRRPPALSPSEAEDLAIQDGRLPPIFEYKSFPRQTLTRDDILTFQSDGTEAAVSPKLCVPTVSLLHSHATVDFTEPVKQPTTAAAQGAGGALKAKALSALEEPSNECGEEELGALVTLRSAPSFTPAKSKSETGTKTLALRVLNDKAKPTDQSTVKDSPVALSSGPTRTTPSLPLTHISKAGGKRKFAVNDENAVIRGMKAASENEKAFVPHTKAKAEGDIPSRELKNPRSIRSLANSRKESAEDHVELKTAVGGRKPLAAKSANEDVSSPRKEDAGKGKLKSNGYGDKVAHSEGRMRNRTKTPLAVEIPALPLPLTDDIVINDETTISKKSSSTPPLKNQEQSTQTVISNELSTCAGSLESLCPQTPPPPTESLLTTQRLVPVESGGRDTPPPADTFLQGETSRPNRRSRASVSYAEPNLRDKMRRPTKELFDAVAGEGKYVQRQSVQTHQDDEIEAAIPAAKLDSMSPTGELMQQKVELVVPVQQLIGQQPRCLAAKHDPYEFNVPSVRAIEGDDEKSEAGTVKGKGATKNTRTSSKTNRRVSTTNTREEDFSAADRHTRPSAARKRTSMVTLKRGSFFDDAEDEAADSSYEPPAAVAIDAPILEGGTLSTRERISRRRSMMP
ncbi:hypothetical protein SEPCBS57363_005985 [Sporothrix epigloea]|uniref:Shugoshin family protein n=1 Tax=Sporothrix epigloea TaxID=1892477 RepID=A0ABP0E4L9_9PEZI